MQQGGSYRQPTSTIAPGVPPQAQNAAALDMSVARLNTAALSASRIAARQNTSIRCLCGASGPRPATPANASLTVQCLGETCGVWQHCVCACHVAVPAAGPNIPARTPPEQFFCELCRSAKTDPFWEVIAHDILPMALIRKTGKQVLVRIIDGC